MATAYFALGVAVIALNLLAVAAGLFDRTGGSPVPVFWYLLRGAQLATMAFVVFACVVYAAGHRASDQLHYVYVLLPVAASFLAELIRGSVAGQELRDRLDPPGEDPPLTPAELSARFAALDPAGQERIGLAIIRRETLIMALACGVNAFLVWRALATTAGLF